MRPARAVPYELHVRGEADFADGTVKLHFANTGKAAAVFQVRSGSSADGPVDLHRRARRAPLRHLDRSRDGQSAYDLSVYGPNGFLRAFRGSLSRARQGQPDRAQPLRRARRHHARRPEPRRLARQGAHPRRLHATTRRARGAARATASSTTASLDGSYDWYDFVIEVESDSTLPAAPRRPRRDRRGQRQRSRRHREVAAGSVAAADRPGSVISRCAPPSDGSPCEGVRTICTVPMPSARAPSR